MSVLFLKLQSNYLAYLFVDDCVDGELSRRKLDAKHFTIAETLGIKPNYKLKEISDKLKVKIYELNNIYITNNPNWTRLSEDEKAIMNAYKKIKFPYTDKTQDVPVYGIIWDR